LPVDSLNIKYDQTLAEQAAGVPPTYYWYEPYTAQRYGIDVTGTTDSTAAMNRAHSIGVVITYPPGQVLFGASGQVTIPGGGIKGSGRVNSIFSSQDTSANNTIICTGIGALLFEDFEMGLDAVKTSGAVIALVGDGTGPGGSLNSYTDFNRCSFLGFPACLSFVQAAFWSVARCFFFQCVGVAISVQNTTNIDGGDSIVGPGNVFNANNSTGFGVYWLSGGGLRVTDNKFLSGNTGVAVSPTAASGSTGDFYIGNNSLENQSQAGISFSRNSGGVTLGHVQIYNNQTAGCGNHIFAGASGSTFITDLHIFGNTCNLSTNDQAIYANYSNDVIIDGNQLVGSGSTCKGIDVTSTCTGGRIGINGFSGTFQYKVSNSGVKIYDLYPQQFGTASSPAVTTAYGALFTSSGSVTFASAYSATDTPPWVCPVVTGGTGAAGITINSISNTGFTYTAIGSASGQVITFNWMALGNY
jgi:hypothetical protein